LWTGCWEKINERAWLSWGKKKWWLRKSKFRDRKKGAPAGSKANQKAASTPTKIRKKKGHAGGVFIKEKRNGGAGFLGTPGGEGRRGRKALLNTWTGLTSRKENTSEGGEKAESELCLTSWKRVGRK